MRVKRVLKRELALAKHVFGKCCVEGVRLLQHFFAVPGGDDRLDTTWSVFRAPEGLVVELVMTCTSKQR